MQKTSTVLPQPRENTSNAKQESSEPGSPVEVQSARISPAKVVSFRKNYISTVVAFCVYFNERWIAIIIF